MYPGYNPCDTTDTFNYVMRWYSDYLLSKKRGEMKGHMASGHVASQGKGEVLSPELG